jgi:hypothetical protein
MNNTPHDIARAQQDRFGRAVAARLSAGTAELPHDFSERLRAARMQALAKRKPALQTQTATTVVVSGGQASLSHGDGPRLWHRVAAVLPLIAFVAGLVAIDMVQNERRASEVAEVDAALLTDTLPPSAYADPGFVQFLKSDR